MSCYVMLYNICHVMLDKIKYVIYNICYVMLCNICHVMLDNIKYVMLCYITYIMLYNICHVMLYDTSCHVI